MLNGEAKGEIALENVENFNFCGFEIVFKIGLSKSFSEKLTFGVRIIADKFKVTKIGHVDFYNS